MHSCQLAAARISLPCQIHSLCLYILPLIFCVVINTCIVHQKTTVALPGREFESRSHALGSAAAEATLHGFTGYIRHLNIWVATHFASFHKKYFSLCLDMTVVSMSSVSRHGAGLTTV